MTPQFVHDNLTALRSQWQESEQGEGKSLIDVQGSLGLLLYDVMEALRLSPQQQMMESHQYQTIHGDMHFGRKTTPTTPQRLGCLAATFFGPQQHKDERVRWYCRACHSPYPDPRRSAAAFVPTHPDHTSEQIVCKRSSSSRIRLVTTAIGHHCGLSREQLPQNDDIQAVTLFRILDLVGIQRT